MKGKPIINWTEDVKRRSRTASVVSLKQHCYEIIIVFIFTDEVSNYQSFLSLNLLPLLLTPFYLLTWTSWSRSLYSTWICRINTPLRIKTDQEGSSSPTCSGILTTSSAQLAWEPQLTERFQRYMKSPETEKVYGQIICLSEKSLALCPSTYHTEASTFVTYLRYNLNTLGP